MRRKHCEITDPKEIDRILSSTNIGRLATNGADGYPYVTPVNFVWLERKVYFHSALVGEKLDNLARDPKVCFEADIPLAHVDTSNDSKNRACKLHQLYHCVIIRGLARVIRDGALKTAALNALVAKHEGGRDFEPVTSDMLAYKNCSVIEIEPAFISAKSDLVQNRTDEERLATAKFLKARNLPTDSAAVRALGFDPEDL
jgi:nitroimidazol reductase NimA-like FMN-containing flavoprotein (pyridoxamine 5'-phosphate oxidase superfamily)